MSHSTSQTFLELIYTKTFLASTEGRIHLLFAYPKNEKSAPTAAERNELKKLAKLLEDE